jgi:beta-N-acetylhexosaminidase
MKNKSTLTFILLLCILAGLLGYNYFAKPFAHLNSKIVSDLTTTPSPVPEANDKPQPFKNLTDQQKISQLLAVPLTISSTKNSTDNATSSAMLDWISANQPGLVTLFGQNIDRNTAQTTIAKLKKNNSLTTPLWIAVDHEGGTVQRLSGTGFTKLPSWSNLCQLPEDQFTNMLASSAAELKNVGVDVVLAPVVDVGSSKTLNSRICSTQPTAVIDKATKYVAAFQKNNLLPVLKHFPGLGQTSQDLHQQFDQVTISADDAIVYRSLLAKNNYLGVMVAPVGVKNQYPEIPCVLSPDCVAELATNFPQTLVFTDALEMKANFHVSAGKPELNLSEVAAQAILSGNQVLIFGPSVTDQQLTKLTNDLALKYQTDELFKEKVNAALTQIINYKTLNKPTNN